MNRKHYRRAQNMALGLAFLMALTPVCELPVQAQEKRTQAEEVRETVSEGDSWQLWYEVETKVDGQWEGHYNATVTLTNTGNAPIDNWHLEFTSKDTIENIWNATILKKKKAFTPSKMQAGTRTFRQEET